MALFNAKKLSVLSFEIFLNKCDPYLNYILKGLYKSEATAPKFLEVLNEILHSKFIEKRKFCFDNWIKIMLSGGKTRHSLTQTVFTR